MNNKNTQNKAGHSTIIAGEAQNNKKPKVAYVLEYTNRGLESTTRPYKYIYNYPGELTELYISLDGGCIISDDIVLGNPTDKEIDLIMDSLENNNKGYPSM